MGHARAPHRTRCRNTGTHGIGKADNFDNRLHHLEIMMPTAKETAIVT
jgi:hypothetical protein